MEKICTNCGSVGDEKTQVRGSFFIELILWLCFLIPGLLYSIWRLSSKRKVCRSCGAENMVPLDSPRGQALRQQFERP